MCKCRTYREQFAEIMRTDCTRRCCCIPDLLDPDPELVDPLVLVPLPPVLDPLSVDPEDPDPDDPDPDPNPEPDAEPLMSSVPVISTSCPLCGVSSAVLPSSM